MGPLPPKNPTDYAVVVGIDWYPVLGPLGGPRRDAESFAAWLRNPAGGGLDPARVRTILSPDPAPAPAAGVAPRPVVSEVQDELDAIDDLARQNNKDGKGLRAGRRLYLYFSGHGFSPDNDETALLMANATLELVGYQVPGRGYANWFFSAGYFDEVVLLMDCCREEYAGAPLNVPHFKPLKDSTAVNRVKLFYAYATKWSRLARERVMNDGKTRGVFTTALLAGLGGAAADPSGNVTTRSLGSYLFQNMRNFLAPADLAAAGIPKEPDLFHFPGEGAGFVLTTVGLPQMPTATVAVGVAGPGTVQLLGPNFAPVAAVAVGPPAWSYAVAPGLYLAQMVAADGAIIDQRSITLAPGGNPNVTF